MAVIKEIKYGSGLIRIHDDYCKNNTKEDNQRIIDNVSKIIIGYYQRKNYCERKNRRIRRRQGENEMLRTDFNGYKEFEKKLMNAKGIELLKLSTERTRVWVNELQEIVGFIPAGDIVFVVAALNMVAEGIKKEYPEAAQAAEALLSGLRYTVKSEIINDNMTEAAGRELYKEFKNK